MFNTSFNLGGDPLVEDIDDALDTLSTSDIDYMYLPEIQKLITIKSNRPNMEKDDGKMLSEDGDDKL